MSLIMNHIEALPSDQHMSVFESRIFFQFLQEHFPFSIPNISYFYQWSFHFESTLVASMNYKERKHPNNTNRNKNDKKVISNRVLHENQEISTKYKSTI